MNFRRCITALAVLALFAGLASAQVLSSTAGTGPFQCTASVAVPPVLRAEGLTEMVGDMVLTCTGGGTPGSGTTPAAGSSTPIPTANFTVSFGTNVTSRLLNYNLYPSSSVTSPNTSEALLLIDEPLSGLQIGSGSGGTWPGPGNIGPGAPQTLCVNGIQPASYMGAGSGGCPEYVVQVGTSGNQDYVMSSTAGTYTPPANVYAGVVSSNQVTFFGIPILPPTSANISRVFRMTNIRINANALGASGSPGTFQVQASISISGSTSVPIYTPVQIAGFVQTGLTTSLKNVGNTGSLTAPNFLQCSNTGSSSSPAQVGILSYTENFGTAFKTRVAPLSATQYSGQGTNPTGQNTPGAIYNSESGFIFSPLVGTGTALNATAGLADYGTRLKAVFNNIPTGVRIFVSTTNVVNISSTSTASQLVAPAGNSTTSFAQLVMGETAPEGSFVPTSGYIYPSNSVTQLNGFAELAVGPTNSATAVWEVINDNPATDETLSFGVWTVYTANAAANAPPTGTATVNMSYAPTPTVAFTAAAGAVASSTLTIPRFADTSTATNLFNVVQCSTSLLFPFITNQAGFDTGFAIMNTTSDPFGSKLQQGTCAFNFYGQNAPPVYTTGVIPAGNNVAPSVYAFLASSIAPSFQGYMIAICNFQLAHGYAFVSDLGAQKLAHGYLALIFSPNPTTTARGNANPEILEN